jgi:hypothetical protein
MRAPRITRVGPKFKKLGRRIREFFLLQEAAKHSSALAPAQLASMRTYHDAARRQLRIAEDLRVSGQISEARALYRQGYHLLALVFLTSQDGEIDGGQLAVEDVFKRFDAAIAKAELAPPPDFDKAKSLVLSKDLLALDRLVPEEARRATEVFDLATPWLLDLVNIRSSQELKVARIVRLTVATAACLGVLGWSVIKVLTPKNYALDRPATSSSASFATSPNGANDGSTNDAFGFHSAEEDMPWWVVDMEKNVTVGEIKVYGRGDCCYDQSIPLALEVSDDGVHFRKIAERSEPFSRANPWVIRPDVLSTRFLRLHTQRRSFLVLSKVEVFAHKSK